MIRQSVMLPLAALLAVAYLVGPARPQDAATPERPNFVFFLVDDLGWRDLGCFGSEFYETPNIDELAAGGMRFTNAYAACQVCSPTRASIQSGKAPARMNTTDYFGGRRKGKMLPAEYVDRLPLEEQTLAEILRETGYRTGFFGKWHLGGEGYWPEDQGYEVNRGGFTGGSPPGGYFSPYMNPKLADGRKGEHLPERLARECIRFIDGHEDQPFLAFLSFYSVHTPLQARQELVQMYREKLARMPERTGPLFIREGLRQARQVQDHTTYAGMVAAMDASIGMVLDHLERRKLDRNTVVLFMSDNGGLSTSEGSPTSNVPLRAGKGWVYEGGIRVPMIVKWPGRVEPGTDCDTPVISHDFLPTILQIAGLPLRPEQHVDGLSLVPLLERTGAPERDALFWHYPHYGNQGGSPSTAVRMGRYKLIHFHEDDRVELYDLESDIGEQQDLAAAQPERVAAMRERLEDWKAEVGARMPTPNPDWKPRKPSK